MESISISTAYDFGSVSSSPAKRKHSSIACDPCRRLKIRCIGGDPGTLSGRSLSKPCDHCARVSKVCQWPEEDGRKRQKTTSAVSSSHDVPLPQFEKRYGRESLSQAALDSFSPGQQDAVRQAGPFPTADTHMNDIYVDESQLSRDIDAHHSSVDSTSRGFPETELHEADHTTVQYARHLGATAIAPGHQKISLKVRRDDDTPEIETPSACGHAPGSHSKLQDPHDHKTLPIFDYNTGFPSGEILPTLLDFFFEYYGDNFCFLNRPHLNRLLEIGEASIFLVCTMCALSSRFCPPAIFVNYFSPREGRKCWEYSMPFLERAKELLMQLLNVPSTEVVAGLLLLSWADFGDNNEAGLWMFTGMSLRMAQELGLHRQRAFVGTAMSQPAANSAYVRDVQPTLGSDSLTDSITAGAFEKSTRIVLFWCVFVQDVCLCSGTGRVPSVKQHEVSVRVSEDEDIAIIRAGPGNVVGTVKPSSFVHLVRMMRIYALSLDLLNVESAQKPAQHVPESYQRLRKLEDLRTDIIQSYHQLPSELQFGATFYRSAVESHEAGPYLVMHLFFHLQITFLTQEIMALGEQALSPSSVSNDIESHQPGKARSPASVTNRRVNGELYRNAIKSVVDLLTSAKFINDHALLATFFLNQSFFHAASAYVHDMLRLQNKERIQAPTDEDESAFPIPSNISPSMVFDVEDDHRLPMPSTASGTESTRSYLALIAKTNYHFLRQAIKDMAKYYAGAGWVDAVLDQRETGLRDVDLSIVGDSISTFIRLHNLRSRAPAEKKSDENTQATASQGPCSPGDLERSAAWAPLSDLPDNPEFYFDPQAFFDEYMSSELTNHNDFPWNGILDQSQPDP